MSKFYDAASRQYVDVSPYDGQGGNLNEQIAAIIAERGNHDAKLIEARRRLNELDSAIRNFNTVRLPAFLNQYCPNHLIHEWRDKVRLVIQNLDEHIPTVETIGKIYANNQNNALMTIYQSYRLAREQLDAAFNGEEFQFDGMLYEVKKGLMKLFLESSGLQPHLRQMDEDSPELIPALINTLFAPYGNDCQVLAAAFDSLYKFNVVHGSLLINWINGKTNCLDTNLGNGNIPQYWKDLSLEVAIITKLQSLVNEIRESLNQEVEKLDSPIQQIQEKAYSFAQSISNMGGDYSVAWQNVFEPYVEVMYPDEFKGITLFNSRVRAWNQSIEKLMESETITAIAF